LKTTEGRIGQFSHDLVPDYLRTKPDPEVENKHAQYESRVSGLNPDQLNKQLVVMEKVTKDLLKHITKEKDDIESRATARNGIHQN
jgi:mediator of RNA polymerase II transcription subunit 8